MTFMTSTVAQTIPNNAWTRVDFDSVPVASPASGAWSFYNTGATTIAAGSDTAVLPQATIFVASTAGFQSTGYICIRIGGKTVVVGYTGTTATSFTGCTGGVGTMATGQVVVEGNTRILPPRPGLYNEIFSVEFVANATGQRGCRLVDDSSGFVGSQTLVDAAAVGVTGLNVSMQMRANAIADLKRVEVFQSSGGGLDINTATHTPALMLDYTHPSA